MLAFTDEQLQKLTEYPREAVEYANKVITRDLHMGKTLANPFGYFEGIVRSFLLKQQTTTARTPSTPKPKARPSNFTEYVEGSKWVPGAKVINNDANYQTSIFHVETDEEFALNYERQIHQRTLENPELAKRCVKFDRNPIWCKLTAVQQQSVWNDAHTQDCVCRTNDVAELLMPDIAQKLQEKVPVHVSRPPIEVVPTEPMYFDETIWEEM